MNRSSKHPPPRIPGARVTAQQPSLARRLGLRDAIAIGLASMIGAGVFAVWHPAAERERDDG